MSKELFKIFLLQINFSSRSAMRPNSKDYCIDFCSYLCSGNADVVPEVIMSFSTLQSTSVSVCFRGISRLPSAFVFLRWFKLAHISIQVCTFHDGCKQWFKRHSQHNRISDEPPGKEKIKLKAIARSNLGCWWQIVSRSLHKWICWWIQTRRPYGDYSYLNTDMCKVEPSQSELSRALSAYSSKTYSKPGALNWDSVGWTFHSWSENKQNTTSQHPLWLRPFLTEFWKDSGRILLLILNTLQLCDKHLYLTANLPQPSKRLSAILLGKSWQSSLHHHNCHTIAVLPVV